jgi:hypothetical protein
VVAKPSDGNRWRNASATFGTEDHPTVLGEATLVEDEEPTTVMDDGLAQTLKFRKE